MKAYIFLLATWIAAGSCQKASTEPHTPAHEVRTDSTELIMRISQQNRLYTAECQVHKVVTHHDLLRWQGEVMGYTFKHDVPMGSRKIAIPIDVTLKVYFDFKDFGPERVKRKGDLIYILLPEPKIVVTASRVDHKGIRQYTDLVREEYSDEEMTRLTRKGVQDILRQAPQMGLLETARMGAERVLVPMLAHLGYAENQIRITFDDQVQKQPAELFYDNEGSVVRLIP